MSRKIRTALIVFAAICFAVALYDPVMRFFNNRSMDDEMGNLRSIRQKALEQASYSVTPMENTAPSPGVPTVGDGTDSAIRFTTGTSESAAASDDDGLPLAQTGVTASAADTPALVTVAETAGELSASLSTDSPKTTAAQAMTTSSEATQNHQKQTKVLTASAMSGTAMISASPEVSYFGSGTNEDKASASDLEGESSAAGSASSSGVVAPSPTPAPSTSPTSTPAATRTPFVFDETKILPEYKPLYELNPDLVGWLVIEGTEIDYPVVRNADPEYYLDHDFYKKKNINGQLILSVDCDPYTPSMNIVISGHRMNSGKMFGDLSKYASQKYGRAHADIEFDTLFIHGRYKLIAVYYTRNDGTDVTGLQYNLNIEYRRQMIDFLKEIEQAKLYDTGVDVNETDQLLTLSTCSYHVHNGRFVVVARRVRAGEEN